MNQNKEQDPGESDAETQWPTDKLNALRLGRRLVTEVPATTSDHRGFVSVNPVLTSADGEATREGWARADEHRGFHVEHWEYHADSLDGFDFDRGAARIRAVTVTDETELITLLEDWRLDPREFRYPWQTDDPR